LRITSKYFFNGPSPSFFPAMASADVAYIPAEGGDRFTVFSFALFAQMLACKISVAIGNNPDAPRALKKITITK
ncbi:MAG: hypothetical protein IJR61_03030, partial [Clostridia bacterium]|nr:hypothetical protein [Clostridia bacterium]